MTVNDYAKAVGHAILSVWGRVGSLILANFIPRPAGSLLICRLIMTGNITIRTIRPEDDATIARLIRETLTEFGLNRPGTVFTDKATDELSAHFRVLDSIYYVAVADGRIIGGAGIYPLENCEENICELQKMYLLPWARGKGVGKLLMENCLAFARDMGFEKCYLETMPELRKAIGLYERFGFRYLKTPMGNTGHFSCGVWMIKELN